MTDAERQASQGHRSPGIGGDFDPASVPIRNAATVLIIDERPDLEVLMLKRNARSAFVGDMWVFPGGAVDPGDASAEADAVVHDLTDRKASSVLGVANGGIAFWVAALRETFEEAGILLGHRAGDEGLVDLSDPMLARRFEAHRDGVNDGSLDFISMARDEGLRLDGSGVHYVGHWVTPVGPPRRYDTRFFLTAMPTGQVPLHDNDEAVHHEWVSPTAALAANETDRMLMMTPTLSMLQRLTSFASIGEAMDSAARATDADDETVRIRFDVEGHARIAYPGDPDYADASGGTENGRLRWPQPAR